MTLLRRKRKYTRRKKEEIIIDPKIAREIGATLLIIFGILFFFSLFGLAGVFGKLLYQLITFLFGRISFLISLFLIFLGVAIFFPEKIQVRRTSWIGLCLFFLFLPALIHLFIDEESALEIAKSGGGGGLVGFGGSYLLFKFFGLWASFILLLGFLIISIMLIFQISLSSALTFLKSLFRKKEVSQIEIQQEGVPVLAMMKKKTVPEQVRPTTTAEGYQFPPIDLLESPKGLPTSGDINKNLSIIAKTLANFGISVTMSDVYVGPTVTQYTLKPAEGVKLSQITARANDLALALAAHPIRIEAPIPGKALVGIEVPNQKRAIVTLKEMFLSKEWKENTCKLPIALGRDVAATPCVVNLEKMPHLLVAGSTGSGKTIFLNALILSLLYSKTPSEVKFILIDPKRVEFTLYDGLPHLITPVVVDLEKTISTLKWAVYEMERRYKVFQEAKKRDIETYNQTAEEKMPYLIIIIDELADIMALAPSDVEASIVRLAQMARATGIHLVVATQRPSVDVITGLIKANITARVAFAVASQVDSRTILDTAGAERLLGEGDMLYQASDIAKPRRIQGAMVRESEVKRVVSFIKSQVPEVVYPEEITEYKPEPKEIEGPEDELYEKALEIVVSSQRASASLLQRRLRVGYARAARLLDLLEAKGVIGPQEGSKPREVLVKKQEE